jgi:hypothetical protein
MAFHEMASTSRRHRRDPDELDRRSGPALGSDVGLDRRAADRVGANGRSSASSGTASMTLRTLFETWPDGNFGTQLSELSSQSPKPRSRSSSTPCGPRAKAAGLLENVRLVRQAGGADLREPEPHLPLADAALLPGARRDLWPRPRHARHADDQDAQHGRAAAAAGGGDRHARHLHGRRRRRVQSRTCRRSSPARSGRSPATAARWARRSRSFPDPRLDLNGIVLQDLRGGVKQTMMDNELPLRRRGGEVGDRDPRARQAAGLRPYRRLRPAGHGNRGAGGAARARARLQSRPDPADLPIDQLLVKVQVKSPMAIARQMQRTQNMMSWLQMVIAS